MREMGRRRWPLVATMVLLAVVLVGVAAGGRERVQWLVADRVTVNNASDFLGAVEFDGAVDFDSTAEFDGAVDMDSTLDVAGDLTLSAGDLVMENDESLSNDTDGTITVTANIVYASADVTVVDDLVVGDDAEVQGDLLANTGTITGALSAADLTASDDLVVGDDAEVQGDLLANTGTITGALSVDGATDLDSTLSVAGDLTVEAEETGGNAGAKNQIIGLPRITAAGLLTGTNGTTESTAYIDTTPGSEWVEIDSGTAVAVTTDTTTYRATTNSVKIAFTAAYTVGDGVDGTITQDDLSGNESIGFYLRSSVATSSGDFKLTLDDTNGTDQSYDVPAVAADTWTWVEINIAACDANCDTVDGIKFTSTLSESLNLGAHNVWLDAMYKWDSADEEALGQAILQDGVLFVLASPVAAAGLNTSAALVEWTDYIVNYQTGSDVIVWLSDQSANANTAFIAY